MIFILLLVLGLGLGVWIFAGAQLRRGTGRTGPVAGPAAFVSDSRRAAAALHQAGPGATRGPRATALVGVAGA